MAIKKGGVLLAFILDGRCLLLGKGAGREKEGRGWG